MDVVSCALLLNWSGIPGLAVMFCTGLMYRPTVPSASRQVDLDRAAADSPSEPHLDLGHPSLAPFLPGFDAEQRRLSALYTMPGGG